MSRASGVRFALNTHRLDDGHGLLVAEFDPGESEARLDDVQALGQRRNATVTLARVACALLVEVRATARDHRCADHVNGCGVTTSEAFADPGAGWGDSVWLEVCHPAGQGPQWRRRVREVLAEVAASDARWLAAQSSLTPRRRPAPHLQGVS